MTCPRNHLKQLTFQNLANLTITSHHPTGHAEVPQPRAPPLRPLRPGAAHGGGGWPLLVAKVVS